MGNKISEIEKDWVKEIVENLEGQMVQAILEMGDEAHESFSLAPYSLGYLFGFSSGGLEFHHIDQNLEKVKILIQMYAQLFGKGGHEILQTTLNLNHEEHKQFKEGAASGREEILRWFHRQENPLGLLRYLLNGEKTKSLNSQLASAYWAKAAFPLAV